ncbi:MAG TPA: hypothetical protein DEO36_10610, partial [Flavobacteriaceae bacterium]|nr:hypothetical protein [Flavobacteriaceae bacterium]
INWSFTGVGPAGSIILNGFTITGQPNAFTNLITPDNVIISVNDLNSNGIRKNGAVIADGSIGLAAFTALVLTEAQDTDLNHYLVSDAGTVQGDYVDYLYDKPIIA